MIDLRLVGKQVYVLGRPKPLASTSEGRRRAHPVGLSSKRSINNKTPNKGGRPTKKLSEKRKYRITVKMATEEYYAMKLKAKNAGVSASEIVRMAIRDCHIRARLTTEQADYIRKLCGMANNLNQLTRKAHREGVRLHYGQCQHLLLSLETIIDHISL